MKIVYRKNVTTEITGILHAVNHLNVLEIDQIDRIIADQRHVIDEIQEIDHQEIVQGPHDGIIVISM